MVNKVIVSMQADVQEHARVIKRLGRRVVTDLLEIGHRLTALKALLPHGQWLPCLQELAIPVRTAQRLMRVAEVGISDNLTHLPLSFATLEALMDAPDALRQALVTQAEAGKRLTAPMVRALIEAEHPTSDPLADLQAIWFESALHEAPAALAELERRLYAPTATLAELVDIVQETFGWQQRLADWSLHSEQHMARVLAMLQEHGQGWFAGLVHDVEAVSALIQVCADRMAALEHTREGVSHVQ
jgi:hypothetical protein